MSNDYLFVYGTLRKDSQREMALELAKHARLVGPAHYQGRLYRISYYPGVVPSDNPQDRVLGEVFELLNKAAILPQLDEYEGIGSGFEQPYEYERSLADVTMMDGQTRRCWIYLYRHAVSDAAPIPSGDFLA